MRKLKGFLGVLWQFKWTFWSTLLWWLGPNMVRFRKNSAHLFYVSKYVSILNLRKMQANLGVLSRINWKFWGTLLWGLGPNMDRFRKNLAHLFYVSKYVSIPNLRKMQAILGVLSQFKWKFWGTLLWGLVSNMVRFR